MQSGRCGEGVSYCLGRRWRNKEKEAAKNKEVVVKRETGKDEVKVVVEQGESGGEE